MKTVYLLVSSTVEYNDEYYYSTDGYNVGEAYESQTEAQAAATARNVEYVNTLELPYYNPNEHLSPDEYDELGEILQKIDPGIDPSDWGDFDLSRCEIPLSVLLELHDWFDYNWRPPGWTRVMKVELHEPELYGGEDGTATEALPDAE